MATSSAGTRATSIALQLKVSSSVGATRATTKKLVVARMPPTLLLFETRTTNNRIVVAHLLYHTLLVS